MTRQPINIGGFTPLTTIDFPGELAAVVFCQGCPWRCGYCQNTDLIPTTETSAIAWQDILQLLERRRTLLDGVVFSGGEPTLQKGLGECLQEVRAMGFKTGLHTGGVYPERLTALLPHLDWVGLDIKATEADYERITGVPDSGRKAWESVQLLLDSEIPCEFRTTVHPDLMTQEQLLELAHALAEAGADNLVLQDCVTRNCLDEQLRNPRNPATLIHSLRAEMETQFSNFYIRAA
jgi:pyruvate formate lyase activating enzyme